MKKYIVPTLQFRKVHVSDVITTSTPGINGQDANPNEPAMAPKKGKDWQNW